MRTVVLIATLLVSSQFARAQAPKRSNTREGFWIGFGVGGGSARIDCTDFCGSGRTTGGSGHIRMGGTLSPHLLLGGETDGWVNTGGFGTDVIGFASLVALWYPSRTGAFYLKFGLGGMRYSTSNGGVADITTVSADAPSATLGVGYEVRVGSGVSLAPWIDVLASSRVQLDYNLGFIQPPTSPPDVRINVVQAGLGITWH